MVDSTGRSGPVSAGGYTAKISRAKPAKNQGQKFDPDKASGLTGDEIRKLNSRDLNKLLQTYMNFLTEKQFVAITPEQIKTIDLETIPKIPTNLIRAMTKEQIQAFEWWQLTVLTGTQIAYLTDEQIKSFVINQSEGLAQMLSKRDVSEMTPSDRRGFLNKLELNNPVVYAEVIKSMKNPGSKLPLSR